MNAIIKLIFILLGWTGGIFVGSFLLVQCIIIVCFGIPFTFEMKSKGILKSMAPVARYLVSFVLLLGLFTLVTWATWSFCPKHIFRGYLVGVASVVLLGIRKFGRNQDNISDFFKANARYVNPNALQKNIDDSNTT